MENSPTNRPGYGADLYRLYRYVHHGVRSVGGGYRFQQLKRLYPTEYAELKAERDYKFYGQGEMFMKA